MHSDHFDNVEAVAAPMAGAEGAFIQWLVAEDHGAEGFYMRRIIVEKGCVVPDHAHPEEHQIFVLTGKGKAVCEGAEAEMAPGRFLHVPGGKTHQFVNQGDEALTFICCINKVAK